jgi:uncharacterized metal-binding protein
MPIITVLQVFVEVYSRSCHKCSSEVSEQPVKLLQIGGFNTFSSPIFLKLLVSIVIPNIFVHIDMCFFLITSYRYGGFLK